MIAAEQASKQLATEGYSILSTFGRRVSWTCPAGHSRTQDVYDVLRGHRCIRCRRQASPPPRAPVVVQPGHIAGDLVCVKHLGVVNGHSRLLARNVLNGREGEMSVHRFLKLKRKLHSEDQLRESRVRNGKMSRGRPNPQNSRHTFGDLLAKCQEKGFEFLHPILPSRPLFRTRTGGVWAFRCHCGSVFYPEINNVIGDNTNSCGCVKSKPQAELYSWVRGQAQDAVFNDRSVIGPLELDIWIPSRRLAIEFCGLYWHGEGLCGPGARTKHLDKLEACQRAGVGLITVFEDEWCHDREAVKEHIQAILEGRGTQATFKEVGGGVWELDLRVPDPATLGNLVESFWAAHPQARSLIARTDLRWGDGSAYRDCGFAEVKRAGPRGWWFKKNGPLVRYETCPSGQRWDLVWDCGWVLWEVRRR